MPRQCTTVEELLNVADHNDLLVTPRSIREVAGQAFVWALWMGRNEKIFNNKDLVPHRTTSNILSYVFLWCYSRDISGNSLGWLRRCCVPPVVNSDLPG